jgi:V/A-type H+-transporting ATPase subunit A
MTMETSKSLREDFLHQNSFHEIDTYASMDKQVKMLRNILTFHRLGMQALSRGALLRELINAPIREEIARMRYVEESNLSSLDDLEDKIKDELSKLTEAGGEEDVA